LASTCRRLWAAGCFPTGFGGSSPNRDVVAIKIAPFNRYQTLDVVRAVAESDKKRHCAYTGNDDNIVADLSHPSLSRCGRLQERRIVEACWAQGRLDENVRGVVERMSLSGTHRRAGFRSPFCKEM